MYIVKNEGNCNLENRLKQIIPLAEEIKILVGFFYFSGLDAIYEALKNNENLTLKVLVGQKVFDRLYVVNFFPTEKGENLTKQREIAENKLFLIHNSIGEDAKIFSPDEEPTPSQLYQRLTKNPDETEEESFFTKAIKEFQQIKEKEFKKL